MMPANHSNKTINPFINHLIHNFKSVSMYLYIVFLRLEVVVDFKVSMPLYYEFAYDQPMKMHISYK